MDQLPSSIEAYLEEAGFSGTEILILRRLMDGEPLTIRQLGAKTGKSTGVLDQAMKKLMKKNIIKKALVNDSPKYSLDSLESVVEWMQDDMEQKRDMLLRRHQNFESFVTSLESGNKRPDIEYFEGEGGIKQAYIKLLNGPGEIFHYLPVTGKEEEDPLRDFRVQYFRERQNRKMFSRVLAHDNPLGRRYQSRDAFEYRKTVLVSEAEYPFTFEKIITGDRIACFDHKAKTACVIRYPELADIEKTLFEAIWRQVQIAAATTKEEVQKVMAETAPERIAKTTLTMSQVREFFLSPKSWLVIVGCAMLSFFITFYLYQRNFHLNNERIKERVKSIAITAALQFSPAEIEELRTFKDIQKIEYRDVVGRLDKIRDENEGVVYAYIFRPTNESGVWRFVADADSIDPFIEIDVNGDGKITRTDHLATPGEIYVEPQFPVSQQFIFDRPAAYDAATDQWGTLITGSAPIRNAQGDPIAIVGIDIETDYLNTLTKSQFKFVLSFAVFFALFIFIKYLAFRPINSAVLNILFARKKP
jgi:DNA-binding HxlR family transcriptional regulator